MPWIEIDGGGNLTSPPVGVSDLARFGHTLRRVTAGWIAWDYLPVPTPCAAKKAAGMPTPKI